MSGGWSLRKASRQIWFRAALYSLVSILLALAAAFVSPLLPNGFGVDIGQDSVGSILNIIASSMLAVTTFSLTAMVSAYGSATSLATPRATQLMIEDPTAQRALSTFLGAFLFAIVGIIALSTGLYGPGGRTILFIGTIVLVLVIVGTLLLWIGHITAFGRMADVIDRVEDAAVSAMREHVAAPHRGGQPAVPIPGDARAILAPRDGYVTHVDVERLVELAGERGVIHVVVPPGVIAHGRHPIAFVEGIGQDQDEAIAAAFAIDRHRDFEQDPRLGIIALSEIASRALSPAVNDPGTAIEVLNALRRVMALLSDCESTATDGSPCVRMPAPTVAEMMTDAFAAIARDGAGMVEVGIRLQKTLASLAQVDPAGAGACARTLAHAAFERACETLDWGPDRERLAAAKAATWERPGPVEAR